MACSVLLHKGLILSLNSSQQQYDIKCGVNTAWHDKEYASMNLKMLSKCLQSVNIKQVIKERIIHSIFNTIVTIAFVKDALSFIQVSCKVLLINLLPVQTVFSHHNTCGWLKYPVFFPQNLYQFKKAYWTFSTLHLDNKALCTRIIGEA